jgi:hypothetical protein
VDRICCTWYDMIRHDMIRYIFNCNWVDIRWQQYSSHLHTNMDINHESYLSVRSVIGLKTKFCSRKIFPCRKLFWKYQYGTHRHEGVCYFCCWNGRYKIILNIYSGLKVKITCWVIVIHFTFHISMKGRETFGYRTSH